MFNFLSVLCAAEQQVIEPAKVFVYTTQPDIKSIIISIVALIVSFFAFAWPIIYKYIPSTISLNYIEPNDEIKDLPTYKKFTPVSHPQDAFYIQNAFYYHCSIKNLCIRPVENASVILEYIIVNNEKYFIHCPLKWMYQEIYADKHTTRNIRRTEQVFDLFREDCNTHEITFAYNSNILSKIANELNDSLNPKDSLTLVILVDSDSPIRNKEWKIVVSKNITANQNERTYSITSSEL